MTELLRYQVPPARTRFYAPGVPVALRVPETTLPALLDAAAGRRGRRTAVVCGGRRTGYTVLRHRAVRLASSLAAAGVCRGARVALLLPAGPQAVTACHAVWLLGAVVVPLDPGTAPEGIRRRLAHSGAVVVLCAAGAEVGAGTVRSRTRSVQVIEVPAGGGAPPWRLGRARRPVRSPARAHGPRAAPSPGDPAVLLYEDGWAVMLTHRNLVAAAHQLLAWLPELTRRRATVLCLNPPWRASGLLFGVTGAALAGARVILEPRPEPEAVLWAARRYRPVVLAAPAGELRRLLARPEHEWEALSGVRTLVSGQLDEESGRRLRSLVDAPLVESYGPADAAGIALANPRGPNARAGTAGIAVPGAEVRVAVEGFPHAEALPGRAGELLLRGPQVCPGYWRDGAATQRRLLPGGWLRTGRAAVAGPDGFVTLLDRGPHAPYAGPAAVMPARLRNAPSGGAGPESGPGGPTGQEG
ncbi:AMP-binding protein [Streptomyces verrucosisporus]|uniref:AMP-binding protein n=1 Tax=Streptomyces verrucosisporus TaxID=1695161 RepID=UPI0019D2D9D1|nr:AMP-binding protein [Streptomyces verrucosisporus]MBN3929885.1 AMP-binding protein [Streptomyces verrucosisporus]